jgi:glycosyl hydrolase family 2
VVSLAGTWDFTPAGGTATTIQVPGGGWAKQGFTQTSGTYQTRVKVPARGGAQTTLIEFGAVNHEATLSVDGVVVGTSTTSFTPALFDLTAFVVPGIEHTISVAVKGRNALSEGRGKLVPDAAGWSRNIPQGIFRSAELRVYPAVYISDVFVRTSVTDDALTFDAWVTNTGTADRDITLTGGLDSWNRDPLQYPIIPAASLTVRAGETAQVTVGPVAWGLGPDAVWWPNVPYRDDYVAKLHNLRVAIRDGRTLIHERVQRFGFREVTQAQADAQSTYYYLNGVRVNFRGDNLQGANYDSIVTDGGPGDAYDTFPGFLAPSAGNPGWPQAVRNYQRLNYNVNRIHQEPATPYMLDVADELGLMIIGETAIRGSNRDQDFSGGHDNMVAHARALVRRDRNHPSIVRWSQSNEANLSPLDSIQFEDDLYQAIVALDPTRPVSADVFQDGNVYDALSYSNFAVIPHYIGGIGVYTDDVQVRSDRPYGQGELIWPVDQTRQGLMWFATSTMAMRAKNASDIRPYTLLSGWASVIPGVTTAMMMLEPIPPGGLMNPPLFGEDNLPDPWSHPILMRIQRAFNPVLVADVDYWLANRMSNTTGDWPVVATTLPRNADVERNLIVFNDTFAGMNVDVDWEVRAEVPAGAIVSSGREAVDIPLGFASTRTIQIHTPLDGTRCTLVLRAQKDGVPLFEDTDVWFALE